MDICRPYLILKGTSLNERRERMPFILTVNMTWLPFRWKPSLTEGHWDTIDSSGPYVLIRWGWWAFFVHGLPYWSEPII